MLIFVHHVASLSCIWATPPYHSTSKYQPSACSIRFFNLHDRYDSIKDNDFIGFLGFLGRKHESSGNLWSPCSPSQMAISIDREHDMKSIKIITSQWIPCCSPKCSDRDMFRHSELKSHVAIRFSNLVLLFSEHVF